jgi:DNA (cytosine-5)-methyltransferase 1
MNRSAGAVVAERRIVDLFAGAGGWEEGLRELGYSAVGIDNDRWACATARAAGHERVEADIAALDPEDFAPVWGLIGSPPCQAYSNAGRKLGREDKPQVIACAHELAAGHDTRAERLAACRDPRSLLTVEPLRWALALRPRWVALEQVPGVLELWSLFCGLLEAHGYEASAGVLSAEQFGVPQTRKRAYLVASLDGPAQLPAPTHRSYNPRRPEEVREEERDLLPWVSMAEALGWARDAVTHTNNQTDSGRRPRGLARPARCPARTLDGASGSWTVERRPKGEKRDG